MQQQEAALQAAQQQAGAQAAAAAAASEAAAVAAEDQLDALRAELAALQCGRAELQHQLQEERAAAEEAQHQVGLVLGRRLAALRG